MAASVTYATDYTVTEDQTWSGLLGDTATTASDTISVSDGAVFTIDTGTTSHALGQLNVDGASVDVQYGDTNTPSAFVTGTTISLTNNSKITLNVLDSAGWGKDGATFSTLNLTDSALELKARQTWGANINLNGGATIKNTDSGAASDTKLDVLQGNMKIGVTGQNNAITTVLNLRSNLTINNGGGLSLANITSGGSGTLTINANGNGSLNITGNVDRGVNLKVHENGGHAVTFGGGAGTRAYVSSLELGDHWGVGTLNVLAGYTVAITGNNNGNNEAGGYKTASLILGEWGSRTTANISGSLLAQNACLTTGDVGGSVNIENGGVLAVQGIMRANTGVDANMELTLKEGGKLILGNKGITFEGSGTKTFDLQGGTLGISADSTVNVALTVSGNVTVDTDTYTFSDNGGTISKGSTAGTLTLAGGLNGTGTITTVGSGTLALGETTTTVSFDLQGGSLGLGGTLTLDGSSMSATDGKITITSADLANFAIGAASFKDVDGSTTTGNGFDNGSERIIVSGGTLDSDVTVDVEGTTFTITNDDRGIVTATTTDYSTYFLNTGTATLSVVQGAATAAGGTLSTVSLAGDTTLNADASLVAGQSISLSGSATVNIGADGSINQSDVARNGNALTISGEGKYVVDSPISSAWRTAANNPNLDATLGEDWTGTVTLNGGAGNGLNFDNFVKMKDGASQSTVELKGVQGYMAGTSTEHHANIILTNTVDGDGNKLSGYTQTDGNGGATNTFSGKISGDGDFERKNSVGGKQTFTFTGDVSEWTGSVILDSTLESVVNFNGNSGGKIGASVLTKNSGAVTVNISNDNAVSVDGSIGKDGATGALSLNVSGTGAKTLAGDVAVDTATVSGGNVTMANLTTASTASVSTNLNVTGDATFGGQLTLGAANTLAVTGTLTLNSGLELLTKIDVTDVQETVSYTIATAGSLVGLDTISLDKVMTGTLAEGVDAAVVFDSSNLSLQLTYTPVTPPTPTEAVTVTGVTWTGDALQVMLAGDIPAAGELAVLVSGEMWKQMMATVTGAGESVSEGVAFSLVDGNGDAIDLTNITAVTFNGYAGEGAGNYAVIFIPEPTTATLGLLALAGLVARRRRKH